MLIEANIVTRHRMHVDRPIVSYAFRKAKHIDQLNYRNREIHVQEILSNGDTSRRVQGDRGR